MSMEASLKLDCSEELVLSMVLKAIGAWNEGGDKAKLQAVRSLLSGVVEQQLISSVRPFLVQPGGKVACAKQPAETLQFVAPNAADAQPVELRKQLSALRQKTGERGVVADDMALAIAFAMFCDSMGLKVTAKPQVSAYKPEDFERRAKRPGKGKNKRKRRGGSIWTVAGGATGMQQTRAKLKY
ncbi:hypothetical protein [Denitromonas sp.]|uniref:hypothetical protein n=1 Tax=Denitromonas sp. TaxID=2734609 RepID=UPI002AFFBD3C|nr:hypothetical protein [Denitromonas sp.]